MELSNYAHSTKSRKTTRHQLFKPFSIQQLTKTGNQTGPTGPWHFPFQVYLTLRIVKLFSTLPKLLFLNRMKYLHCCHFLKSVHFSLGHLTW